MARKKAKRKPKPKPRWRVFIGFATPSARMLLPEDRDGPGEAVGGVEEYREEDEYEPGEI